STRPRELATGRGRKPLAENNNGQVPRKNDGGADSWPRVCSLGEHNRGNTPPSFFWTLPGLSPPTPPCDQLPGPQPALPSPSRMTHPPARTPPGGQRNSIECVPGEPKQP